MKFLLSLLFLLLTLLSIVIYIVLTRGIEVPSFSDDENTTEQVDENITDPKKIERKFQNEDFEKKWDDVNEYIQKAVAKYTEIDNAGKPSFFWDKRKSLRSELFVIFDEIVKELQNERINEHKEKIKELEEEIKEEQTQIMEYRTAMKEAPQEHFIKTTVDEYKADIKELQETIDQLEQSIVDTHNSIRAYIYVLGIELPYSKIDLLQQRIDFPLMLDNALVMKMMQKIIIKFKKRKKFNEYTYEDTLNYHRQNRILFELLIYQQNRYLQKINNDESGYLKLLDDLLKENDALYEKSAKNMVYSKNEQQKSIYRRNMQALKLFRQVVEIYKKDIWEQRRRLLQVRLMSAKHLRLTQNRYETAMSSYEVLRPTRDMNREFQKIIKHYFDNIEITFKDKRHRQKYIEVTKELQKKIKAIQ